MSFVTTYSSFERLGSNQQHQKYRCVREVCVCVCSCASGFALETLVNENSLEACDFFDSIFNFRFDFDFCHPPTPPPAPPAPPHSDCTHPPALTHALAACGRAARAGLRRPRASSRRGCAAACCAAGRRGPAWWRGPGRSSPAAARRLTTGRPGGRASRWVVVGTACNATIHDIRAINH